jgi:gluconate 2-dehydrogenase gamma chain
VLRVSRRQLLGTSAMIMLVMSSGVARAAIVRGDLPWKPGSASPPTPVTPGGWKYFTAQEASTVEGIVERLIPADDLSPSGKDCGCAVYIDRQLAGPYGRSDGFYMLGPFQQGTKQQGPQSSTTPAQSYREGLTALDKACQDKFGSKHFADLTGDERDAVIKGLEDGSFKLDGADGQDFFKLILKDTQTGFLADPIYGGNNDMASWKMIGFPGAHYDYREWIDKHNQPVTLPPVGMADHPNWSR